MLVLRAVPFIALALLIVPLYTAAAACPNLTRTLSFGSRGEDVVALQTFLIAQGDLEAGNDTGYFRTLTETAVRKFQCEHNVICEGTAATTGYGVVGARTRAAIQVACGDAIPEQPQPGGPVFRLPITPPFCFLTADPAYITRGASSTLSWNSSGTTTALWPFGIVSQAGERSVAPSTTAMYLLVTSDGPESASWCTAMVSILPPISTSTQP